MLKAQPPRLLLVILGTTIAELSGLLGWFDAFSSSR